MNNNFDRFSNDVISNSNNRSEYRQLSNHMGNFRGFLYIFSEAVYFNQTLKRRKKKFVVKKNKFHILIRRFIWNDMKTYINRAQVLSGPILE